MSWEVSDMVYPFEHGLRAPDDGITRAVIISLFSDDRAHTDDVLPDGTDDRRGFWADSVLPPQGAQQRIWATGSRLWLLSREKQTAETARRAREYAEEALQWLLSRGDARHVNVDAVWRSQGLLALPVRITLADGSVWEKTFLLREV